MAKKRCREKNVDFNSSRYIIAAMDDTAKFDTTREIDIEMTLVQDGERRSWGEIFMLLDSIDQRRYWLKGASSFSDWLENNAYRLRTKAPTLWRYLSSGRFVRQIAELFEETGVDIVIPSLEKLSEVVSPENIELLAKLYRVTPEDTFVGFARKVLAGESTRAELRRAWETYRPSLKGKTARGRGGASPLLNRQDPEQFRSMMEAATLDAFQAAGPAWMGIQRASVYKVFVHVNPDNDIYRESRNLHLFAAVVVVKSKNSHLRYHGIRFLTFSRPPEPYERALAYCDHLWVFGHSESYTTPVRASIDYLDIPDGIGILEVRNGTVSVIKQAGVVEGAGSKRLDLASALLIRALRTK